MPKQSSRTILTLAYAALIVALVAPLDSEARGARGGGGRSHSTAHNDVPKQKHDEEAAPSFSIRPRISSPPPSQPQPQVAAPPPQPTQAELERQAAMREQIERSQALRREQADRSKQMAEERLAARHKAMIEKATTEPQVAPTQVAKKPGKITGYRDANGTMTFTDGTGAPR